MSTTISYSSFGIQSTTDAEFRTWVSNVHAMIVAAGLVNTSDTGQIDTSTVARPVGTAIAGYKIYRFNDALQATSPIYIKVGFASNSTTGTSYLPCLYVSVGSGTDGAMTLSSATDSERLSFQVNNASTATVQTSAIRHAATSDGTSFGLFFGIDGASLTTGTDSVQHPHVIVARTVDSNGDANAQGSIFAFSGMFGAAASANYGCWFVASPISTWGPTKDLQVLPTPMELMTRSTGVSTAGIAVSPIVPTIGITRYPIPQGLVYYANDLPIGTLVQLTVYGRTKNYRAMGVAARVGFQVSQAVVGPGTGALLWLWE